MSRRVDFGIASYRNPEKLRTTLASIEQHSRTEWRCFIIHNPSEHEDEAATREVIAAAVARNPRFVAIWGDENAGYVGVVNALMDMAETDPFIYCDNDIEILTDGWDETLCGYLDRFHELGMVFPNGGAYQINRGNYTEVLWGVGFCWAASRLAVSQVGKFDTELGHHEEVDYSTRLRLAGWKLGAAPEVRVAHNATASNDPASQARIARGVEKWVNKWVRYFCGSHMNYHSPNVMRFEDWPPSALYLEEYRKAQLPDLNASPEVVTLDGRQYDLIKVPRFSGFYRGRIL